MRAIAVLTLFALPVAAGACTRPDELVRRSDAHRRNAQAAAAAGDRDTAAREQHRAFRDYEKAASRAYLAGRPVPAPPPTPPVMPERSIF